MGRIGSGVWDAASFQIVALRILLHFAVVTTVAILGRVLFRDAVANIGVLSLTLTIGLLTLTLTLTFTLTINLTLTQNNSLTIAPESKR